MRRSDTDILSDVNSSRTEPTKLVVIEPPGYCDKDRESYDYYEASGELAACFFCHFLTGETSQF
jgi:hypothetical protein